MSAQAVLSMTAPAVAPPSTGTASDVSDSAFETMVADAMDGEAAPADDETAAAPPPANEDVTVDPAQTNPFVMASSASLVPPVIPERTGEVEASATPPAATSPEAPDFAPINADEPATLAPGTADAEAAMAEKTAATPTSAAQPAVQPADVAPPPAPALRPLAERTSKPLEAKEAAEAGPQTRSSVADPSASPEGARPDGAAKSIQPSVNAGVEAAVAPIGDELAPEPEAQAPGESATAQTQTAAAARDVSLSTLSRGAIDATAQIAAQIQRKLEGRSTRFEMALHPEDLGRVDVKLDIDSGGRLSARLAFDNPAAATDLRGRADELRRQLEDAGFHMADDAFEFADRDSGSSSFDRGQDARQGQNRAFAAASRLNAEIDVAQPPRWMALSLSPAGVDLKV